MCFVQQKPPSTDRIKEWQEFLQEQMIPMFEKSWRERSRHIAEILFGDVTYEYDDKLFHPLPWNRMPGWLLGVRDTAQKQLNTTFNIAFINEHRSGLANIGIHQDGVDGRQPETKFAPGSYICNFHIGSEKCVWFPDSKVKISTKSGSWLVWKVDDFPRHAVLQNPDAKSRRWVLSFRTAVPKNVVKNFMLNQSTPVQSRVLQAASQPVVQESPTLSPPLKKSAAGEVCSDEEL